MNSADNDLRQLIARLSDGALSASEARQLNTLLCNDEAAQHALLDHLAVDALLEREFGDHPLPLPRPALSFRKPSGGAGLPAGSLQKIAAGLVIGFLLGSLVWWAGHSPPALRSWKTWTLFDTNFEKEAVATATVSAWHGEQASVVGTDQGVLPQEGDGMLRFLGHPEADDAGVIRQVVDLRPYREQIALSPEALFELSAWFNAVTANPSGGKFNFALQMAAFHGDLSEADNRWKQRQQEHLTLAHIRQAADPDPKSWQRLSAKMAAPAEADYLVFEVRILPASTHQAVSFPGHYVDSIELKLHAPPPGAIASNP